MDFIVFLDKSLNYNDDITWRSWSSYKIVSPFVRRSVLICYDIFDALKSCK
jgi:hypothetical protein